MTLMVGNRQKTTKNFKNGDIFFHVQEDCKIKKYTYVSVNPVNPKYHVLTDDDMQSYNIIDGTFKVMLDYSYKTYKEALKTKIEFLKDILQATENEFVRIRKQQNTKKPSYFAEIHPFASVLLKAESERIALNIMKILKRTGDEFRPLSWGEYKEERLKDGGFSDDEYYYFKDVIEYCESADTAASFSKDWASKG